MASSMADAVDIGLYNAQPGGLLQGKGLIECDSSYPVENGGETCGDPGSQDLGPTAYKLKGLIKGGSSYHVDPDCPLQSYLDSFGLLFRADHSPDERSKKASDIPPASGRPTEAHKLECPSDNNDGDAYGDALRVVLNLTEEPTLASFLLAPYADHAPVSSTDSSTRGVEDLLLQFSEREHEVTSTYKPSLATSDTPASPLFFPWETSKGHLVHSSRADEGARSKEIGFQLQVTPGHVSSTRSSQDSIQLDPQQLGHKDEDARGKENEFQFRLIPAHASSTWSAQDSIHPGPQQSGRKEEDARDKETEFQFQVTQSHVSSIWSLQDSCDPGSPQSPGSKQSSWDLKGKQKALEDGWDGSTSLSSQQSRKRLRPRTERLVPVTIASPILELRLRDPSNQRDFYDFKLHGVADITGDFYPMRRCRYETQCDRPLRRAEGYHRMRMRTLSERLIAKTQEAMSKTLSLLHKWHLRLGLDNANCPTAASRIFYRGFRNFHRSAWPRAIREYRLRVRVLLAAALWVAAKVMEDSSRVPRASQMAEAAGVDVKSLTHTELPLLDTLQWKLLCGH